MAEPDEATQETLRNLTARICSIEERIREPRSDNPEWCCEAMENVITEGEFVATVYCRSDGNFGVKRIETNLGLILNSCPFCGKGIKQHAGDFE